jgi:hypothetical protein
MKMLENGMPEKFDWILSFGKFLGYHISIVSEF